ncbi:MAG: prenyltransferase/squalene oxidase repeat-containing protein [Thomasclavelia sp.]|uniref:prenyltransferase/squalene oxidase repeat-containing protein n=1 Tax=Thomasclavelia sp. TaxID=3025757 RepID=UPI0039A1F6A8
MKKIVSLIVSLVILGGIITPVNGQTDALLKAQNYWLNNKELNSLDAVLTVEALGLDVEDNKNGFVVNYDFAAPVNSYGEMVKYEDMDCGYLSKNIMALVSMKIDPSKLMLADGSIKNLIEILKSKIDDEGNVFYGNGNLESSIIYTMYALSIVEPNYNLSKLGAKLADLQLDDGCWGYNGAWGGPDVTGWAIGALALCGDTYQSSIDKALTYFVSIQQDDGAFVPNDGWSVANSNTQGCVVWGLLEYDVNSVKAGVLKKSYESLMTFLLEDGSFAYKADQDYGDNYATIQAGLALGVYENGSLFSNLRSQYKEMLNPQPNIPENTPTPEENKTIPTDKTVAAVKTGDDALILTGMFMFIVSGGIFLSVKKVF